MLIEAYPDVGNFASREFHGSVDRGESPFLLLIPNMRWWRSQSHVEMPYVHER